MKAHKKPTSEIKLNVNKHTPRPPITSGTMHLKSWPSKRDQEQHSAAPYQLSVDEKDACDTATD